MDRDVLLQKIRGKLRDFPASFEDRPARCNAFFIRWIRCPRCLTYGIGVEFDFPSLCNAVKMECKTPSNRLGSLSPAEHHQ